MSDNIEFKKFEMLVESSKQRLYTDTIRGEHILKIDTGYIHDLCLYIIYKLHVKQLTSFWRIQDIVQMTICHKDSIITNYNLKDKVTLQEPMTFNRLIYIEKHILHNMDSLTVLNLYEFFMIMLCMPGYDYKVKKDNKLCHILLGHIYRGRMVNDLNMNHELSVDILSIKDLIVSVIHHINSYISSYSNTKEWSIVNLSTIQYMSLICIIVMLSRTTKNPTILKSLDILEKELVSSIK